MRSIRAKWTGAAAILLPLFSSGCGGEGGGSSASSATVVVAAAAPAPTPAPAPAPTPTPTPAIASVAAAPGAPPPPSSWNAGVAALYTAAPDVPNCRPGTLRASVRADVLQRMNAIRALHRLPPVTYSDADDEQATQSSLIMAANGALTHTPPSSYLCYTSTGAAGAGSSNLYGGLISANLAFYSEDQYLAGWLTETSNLVANNVGHRRWMLDPFLGKISYGRVAQLLPDGRRTDAATMKVLGFTGGVTVPAGLPDFVAYPYGDYPARYFDPAALLSFSVIADATTRGGTNATVDFSHATITVKTGTTALAVSNISFDNSGYGLPNNLQFAVAGLQNNVSYQVTIANVTVRGTVTNYTYTFRTVP